MANIEIICVDFQKDFAGEGRKHHQSRPSVGFVKKILVPYFREKGIKISEIISDYRLPRPGDLDESCCPGDDGYLSEIPNDVKKQPQWIKCMNSPIWIRENIGDGTKEPGLPYQDPQAFTKWLDEMVGKPNEVDQVVLFGLTADCCVLCTAQELTFRGYKVRMLKEAVDTYSGSQEEKETILNNPPLTNWAEVISWDELKIKLL